VASTLGIPDRFDVLFDADNSIRSCRLVWYKDKEIGVEFAEAEETNLANSV
jgi:hypothetical protein